MSAADTVEAIRSFPSRYERPLTRFLAGENGAALIRTRPEPSVWSALEYTAHARDAMGFYADRVRRVVTEDRPQLEVFGFEAACEERRYAEEDPTETAAGLSRAADDLAELLGGLEEEQWSRIGIGSEGDDRTVLDLARRAAHEGHHHLLDVGRVLRRARESRRGNGA